MNRREFLRASAPLALAPALLTRRGLAQTPSPQTPTAAPPPLPPAGADGWVSLINGRDFSGWYSMLQRSGKGVARIVSPGDLQALHIATIDLTERGVADIFRSAAVDAPIPVVRLGRRQHQCDGNC